ncbi:hypothetical protein [Falsiphaeobacter marinintestinus]|uniref:hypothetical protein n=1 Tax=Falsiphaeobacter marinintestinus TaxID=1492905 RepID=UPI0011B7D2AA|nr:hypothetical protein [Phaeobacter marinintestinus]
MKTEDLMLVDDFLKLTEWSKDTLRQYRHRKDVDLPTVIEVGKFKYMSKPDVHDWLQRKFDDAKTAKQREQYVEYMFQNLDVFGPYLKAEMPDELLRRAGMKKDASTTVSDADRKAELD